MNGVTVAQTVVVSEQRHAALPAELAGSLVLAAADALAALSLRVTPQELALLEDGTVRVCGGVPTDEPTAEQSLRNLLDRVLLSSCSVTPALLRAARRPCQGGVSSLVRELEVALIPTNRGAARRALARLYREVAQAVRQYPTLQQAAEAVHVTPAPVVAQPALVASFTPPPLTVVEPSILDEWIDVSPVFPEALLEAEPSPAVAQAGTHELDLEIPDLEIPGAVQPQSPLLPAQWQPVEHTQKLAPVPRSAPPPPRRKKPPSEPPPPPSSRARVPREQIPPLVNGRAQSRSTEPEYVVLSDDDVHEATAELKIEPPVTLTPPSEATLGFTEYQTAEPFLLVLPALGHAVIPTAEPILPPVPAPTLDAAAPVAEPPLPTASAAAPAAAAPVAEPPLPTAPPPLAAAAPPGEPSSASAPAPALEAAAPTSPPLAAAAPAAEPPLPTVPPPALDAASLEPCAGEAEDTVLDAVTFVEEEPPPPLVPLVAEFEPEASADSLEIIEEYSLPLPQSFDAPEEAKTLGPHSYAAKPKFSRGAGNVKDRIAQFSVAPLESSEQLTRGLRNLAGIEPDFIAEPSKTPPPTAYAADAAEPERPVASGAFVRTLIGLGATGAFIVLGQLTWGRVAPVSAAAPAVPIVSAGTTCRAVLKIADVPVGTTIHVTQAGSHPKSQLVQVSRLPFEVDGLTCGEPAELLVKLTDRGWYRVPVDRDRLRAGGNSEPVRIAAYFGQ